ncbi:MAG: glycine hydroxymethyltransferase [Parachlamydiales bacterium]|nr:glycine hydroxymethyltransferase [Parachlamydiales bacterium]
MTYLHKYFSEVPEKKRSCGAIAFYAALDNIAQKSPEIVTSILQELKDQRTFLKLIASENYSSLAVQQTMGNLFTDKYSEGYVGHRFYAGCDNVDSIEGEAVFYAQKIFGAEHAYVQPHSGADANLVAYWAILIRNIQNKEVERLGKKRLEELTEDEYQKVRLLMHQQKIMGMSLSSGGHLTHGYRQNISSKFMHAVSYEVDPKTGLLDYDLLEEQVMREKPLILVGGYSSYPRKINFSYMREIANKAGSVLMVDMAHFAGLVAGKVMDKEYNPIPYADIVTSTTHKTLRGPRGGLILCKNEYAEVVNKGCPFVLGGPLPHVMAAKAVAFKEASTDAFCSYAEQIVNNARVLAESLMSEGIEVITGGTDNHLVMINVDKNLHLTGLQAEKALRMARITVNRNTIPQDKNGPWHTSGVRIGTAAMTTLGMKEDQMHQIARVIALVLKNTKKNPSNTSSKVVDVPAKTLKQAKDVIEELLRVHRLYPELVIDS